MEELETGLMREESNRFRKYTDLILASGGRVDVLTGEEQRDLKQLLKKTKFTQELFTEAELKAL